MVKTVAEHSREHSFNEESLSEIDMSTWIEEQSRDHAQVILQWYYKAICVSHNSNLFVAEANFDLYM